MALLFSSLLGSCARLLLSPLNLTTVDNSLDIMAVLARSEILTALEDGSIKIEPKPLLAEVGPASVDLTLSNEFRFYKPGLSVIPINEATDYKSITEKVVIDEEKQQYYLLLPGQACLGITKERIQLSQGLCGLLEGRSRFARMGLFVHITAGFMK